MGSLPLAHNAEHFTSTCMHVNVLYIYMYTLASVPGLPSLIVAVCATKRLICMISSQAIGQLGSVMGVTNDGNVSVLIKAKRWKFNPLCIRQADKEEEQEVSSELNLQYYM